MSETNFYIDARREWNERYGSYISRARSWKMVALSLTLTTLMSVCALIWISAQDKLVPYFIEVDKLGRVSSKGFASSLSYDHEAVVKAELNQFIKDVRSVVPDEGVQDSILDDAYAHVASGQPVSNFLKEYFEKNNPFDIAQRNTVTVDISNILRVSESSWQVEWNEIKKNRRGETVGTIPMKASLTLIFDPPETEEEVIANPIGLFIKELSWSKIL